MVKKILILLFVFSSILSHGQLNRFAGFGNRSSTCDADAQKYIDSAAITDATERTAICSCVKQLKDSSLWTDIVAVYPFLGSSSTKARWNAKDPRQDTTSYILNFIGGWVFSSSGALANGTNAYANTRIVPSSVLTIRNFTLAAYINGGTLVGAPYPFTIGAVNSPSDYNVSENALSIRPSLKCFIPNGEGSGFACITNNATTGFFVGTAIPNTAYLYKDGSLLNSTATSNGGLSNKPLGIACKIVDESLSYQNVRLGIVFIYKKGLTGAQVSALNAIVTTFKTTLGR